MGEIFPIATGLALGIILGLVRPGSRLWVGLVVAVPLGVAATILSGEYRISWSFLLIDIPLVAGSAVAALLVTHRLRWARGPVDERRHGSR